MKKIKSSFSKKVAVMIFLLSLALTVAAVFGSFTIFSNTIDKYYKQITTHVAETVAVMADAGMTRRYAEEVKEQFLKNLMSAQSSEQKAEFYIEFNQKIKDKEYQKLLDSLKKIKEANSVLCLYIVAIDPQSEEYIYIMNEEMADAISSSDAWEGFRRQNRKAFSQAEDGKFAYIAKTDKYGRICCAGAPIVDEDGNIIAYVMANRSMNKVMKEREIYLLKLMTALIFFAVILTALMIWKMKKSVVEPINKLTLFASRYVKEKEKGHLQKDTSVFQQLNIHTGDEVEKLCDAFCQMEQDINRYIEDLTLVTAEKERIGAELNIATQIQADMLPRIFPPFPERKEFDIYASMRPAREVGGDFYDFFLVDEKHLALVIADVSGKGVPAALFMVIAKTLIKNQAMMGASPKETLEAVNRQLYENNEAEMFVTVWLGIYDISSHRLTAANAGHEYPVIRRKGGRFELFKERHGFVLAGMEHTRYHEYELELEAGDALFVYTDGVVEATDAQNRLFGAERMLEALNGASDALPEQLIANVTESMKAFVGGAMQFDDVTMLSLQIKEDGA